MTRRSRRGAIAWLVVGTLLALGGARSPAVHAQGEAAPPGAAPAVPRPAAPAAERPTRPPSRTPALGAEAARARAALEKTAASLEVGGGASAPGGGGFKNSRTAALFFWLFALGAIGGAVFVITRRNPIAAVMGLVGTFFALAGLFLMLYASFLAAIQVLVYAGAIMVLFVFVVMILNRPEDEPFALQGLLGKVLAGLAIAYLVVRLGGVLWDLKDTPHAAVAGPRPVLDVPRGDPGDFGSVRAIGNTLFKDYLFPFEAVSLVLLAAVVGAIAVARPHHKDEAPGAGAPGEASGGG
jgi:NADH-quinone oxidoreductase subunit J